MGSTCKSEAEAREQAEYCLMKMKTKGWTVRVWENLGWHWQLRNVYIQLYPGSSGETYHILISSCLPPVGGEMYWTHNVYPAPTDPNEAVAAGIREVRGHCAKVNTVMEVLNQIEATTRPLEPVSESAFERILRHAEEHYQETGDESARILTEMAHELACLNGRLEGLEQK